MGRARVAAVALVAYVVIALIVGEWFPFSRFSMYSTLGRRTEGAVPVLLADGVVARARDFDRYVGLEAQALGPGTRPCSMNYRVDEDRRWIASHSGTTPGPVRIEYGYVPVRISQGRVLRGPVDVVARGRAWPR